MLLAAVEKIVPPQLEMEEAFLRLDSGATLRKERKHYNG